MDIICRIMTAIFFVLAGVVVPISYQMFQLGQITSSYCGLLLYGALLCFGVICLINIGNKR